MKTIKSLKRKIGIYAPRVEVRPHFSGYLRWPVIIAAIGLTLGLGLYLGVYDVGRKASDFDMHGITLELDRLSKLNIQLQQESESLQMAKLELERRAQVEVTSRDDLVKQIKSLGDESIQLKEDLGFLQIFMAGSDMDGGGVSVYHFKLNKEEQSPGEYRYSLLLVQGKQRTKDFQGRLKFTVTFMQDGKRVMMPLPDEDSSKTSTVNFKFYQRLEKSFRLKPDVIVESLQVEIFETGMTQPRLTKVVNLPS